MNTADDCISKIMSTQWSTKALCRAKDRRLTEDLRALGPRPAWWHVRARPRYDRSVQRLKKAHDNDLRLMLAAKEPLYRAVLAHLLGWECPVEE